MDFVDTSAWFAYSLPTDADHERVRQCFRSATGPSITTDYCVDETLTLLASRGELRRAFEAGRGLFERNIAQLHILTASDINRPWILFQQRAVAGWSFTDCTSKIVIDELNIRFNGSHRGRKPKERFTPEKDFSRGTSAEFFVFPGILCWSVTIRSRSHVLGR